MVRVQVPAGTPSVILAKQQSLEKWQRQRGVLCYLHQWVTISTDLFLLSFTKDYTMKRQAIETSASEGYFVNARPQAWLNRVERICLAIMDLGEGHQLLLHITCDKHRNGRSCAVGQLQVALCIQFLCFAESQWFPGKMKVQAVDSTKHLVSYNLIGLESQHMCLGNQCSPLVPHSLCTQC